MKTKSINFQFGVYNISIITLLLTMFSCLPWRSKKSVDYVSPPQTVFKINSSENNPRNSEGDFINLKDGRILFVYSHYYGTSSSDHATAYLAGRYSDDGGANMER